jgi:ATP-dependent Clp protease ATP-binding subunit ClpC
MKSKEPLQRFSDRAAKALRLAESEARRLNSAVVDVEHLLPGIFDEGSGLAAKMFRSLNVDRKTFFSQIEKADSSPRVRVPRSSGATLSLRTKLAIEFAEDVASELGHGRVGPEHLMLGVLKVRSGVARQVLLNLGLRATELRDLLLEMMGAEEALNPKPLPGR